MKKYLIPVVILFSIFPMLMGCSGNSKTQAAAAALPPTQTLRPGETPTPGSIKGTVTWQTGDGGMIGLKQFTIFLWETNDTSVPVAEGITDRNGAFEIVNLLPGTYVLSGYEFAGEITQQSPEACWVIKDIQVSSGQAAQVSLNYKNALQRADFSKNPTFCK